MVGINSKFKEEVKDNIIITTDETSLAEIFNIFANDIDNLEQTLRKEEVYVFNIMDNRQAALAVRKFGFETISKATKDNWIIYAEKGENGKWNFTDKAPSSAVEQFLEYIICDIIARPKEYPSWVIGAISIPLIKLATGFYK